MIETLAPCIITVFCVLPYLEITLTIQTHINNNTTHFLVMISDFSIFQPCSYPSCLESLWYHGIHSCYQVICNYVCNFCTKRFPPVPLSFHPLSFVMFCRGQYSHWKTTTTDEISTTYHHHYLNCLLFSHLFTKHTKSFINSAKNLSF